MQRVNFEYNDQNFKFKAETNVMWYILSVKRNKTPVSKYFKFMSWFQMWLVYFYPPAHNGAFISEFSTTKTVYPQNFKTRITKFITHTRPVLLIKILKFFRSYVITNYCKKKIIKLLLNTEFLPTEFQNSSKFKTRVLRKRVARIMKTIIMKWIPKCSK